MNQNILIIGATSGIAEAVARRYAEQGAGIYLVARNSEKLELVSADLLARGAKDVHVFQMDLNEYKLLPELIDDVWQNYSNIDVALIAHGTLPDQGHAVSDLTYATREFRNNAESIIACLTSISNRFEIQRNGVIAVIGSVAGDRGRSSNYLYGAAKAAIDTFASGLRVRLSKCGVQVLMIKPGFVATSMTANLHLPDKLTVKPDRVAKDIQCAITKRKDVIYTPWFWYWIMIIIRWIPPVIFKRMSI